MPRGVYTRTDAQRRAISERYLIDLSGRQFGYWTVIEKVGVGSPVMWRVRCCCGNEKVLRGSFLKDGTSKSCGCMRSAMISKAVSSHGDASHSHMAPEYRAWANMIDRCANENSASFARYGGRGISVCARWRASYEDFLTDMGRRPSRMHSIDRKDNDGNYEPGNCRWATKKEQSRNTRWNRVLIVKGVARPISEWAEVCGVQDGTLRERLKRGWSPERAVFAPLAMARPRP